MFSELNDISSQSDVNQFSPLIPARAFYQKCIFRESLSLDMGQLSSNLLKNALAK